MTETLGQTLRRFREMLGGPPTRANRFQGSRAVQSQMAVAARAGITQSALCLLEQDRRPNPRRHNVEALAQALRLDEAETDELMATAGHWPFPGLEGDQLAELLRIGRRLVRLQAERREASLVEVTA